MALLIGQYRMPDPDDVCQSEYRAIHELLDDAVGDLPRDEQVQLALASLQEVKDWCDSLIDKLHHAHPEA